MPRGTSRAGFLPQSHQGVILDAGAPRPIPELFPPTSARYLTPESERDGRAVLEQLNRRHAAASAGDSRLESRIAAYELAARMQRSAPEALDLAGETAATRRSTDWKIRSQPTMAAAVCWRAGCSSAGYASCRSGAGLPGRRTTGTTTTISPSSYHRSPAASTGRSPALLRDLKARGLMDDTLVVFSTEFGRQPFTQGATGRDHNGGTSIAWLAGAGIKAGVGSWPERSLGLEGRRRPDLLLRLARHDPAPDGDRPHPAHLPPQRYRPPPDRRPRPRGRRDPGVSLSRVYLMVTPVLEIETSALLPAWPLSAPSR